MSAYFIYACIIKYYQLCIGIDHQILEISRYFEEGRYAKFRDQLWLEGAPRSIVSLWQSL